MMQKEQDTEAKNKKYIVSCFTIVEEIDQSCQTTLEMVD